MAKKAKKAKKPGLIDGTLQKAQDLLEGYIKPGAQSAARSAEATIEEALRMIGEARLRIMSFQRKPRSAARKGRKTAPKTTGHKTAGRKAVARKAAGAATRKRAGAKRKSAVTHKVAAAKRRVGAVKRGRRKTRH
jgi:hypothetical protein